MSFREPRTRLYRVRLDRNGYDSSGYYWGREAPLFCYSYFWRGRETFDYLRASDRDHAKEKVRVHHPDARFYR